METMLQIAMVRRQHIENVKTTARPIDPNRPKMGRAWTPQEEEQLIQAYNERKSIADIAAAHGRTTGAITSRLVKLGLIEDNATNRAGRGHAPKPGQSPIRPTDSRKSPAADDAEYPF
jgi:hypothetical protein